LFLMLAAAEATSQLQLQNSQGWCCWFRLNEWFREIWLVEKL
jgi:hypothetical protein